METFLLWLSPIILYLLIVGLFCILERVSSKFTTNKKKQENFANTGCVTIALLTVSYLAILGKAYWIVFLILWFILTLPFYFAITKIFYITFHVKEAPEDSLPFCILSFAYVGYLLYSLLQFLRHQGFNI